MKYKQKEPSPVVAQISPARHLGAVTERFEDLIDSYLSSNPDKVCCFAASSPVLRSVSLSQQDFFDTDTMLDTAHRCHLPCVWKL